MHYTLIFSSLLFLIVGAGEGQTIQEKNKSLLQKFIKEFWNGESATAADHYITCVCGEKIDVAANSYEAAVSKLIPAMDKHVAAKEHPQVPKDLKHEQKEGMVRSTIKNSILEKYLAQDYVDHSLAAGMMPGAQGLQLVASMFKVGFPDMKITIDDQVAEGDKVVSRVTLKGTNTGEFMGKPATGNQITMSGIRIDRLMNGKIVEHWAVADRVSMMQQLDASPQGKK